MKKNAKEKEPRYSKRNISSFPPGFRYHRPGPFTGPFTGLFTRPFTGPFTEPSYGIIGMSGVHYP